MLGTVACRGEAVPVRVGVNTPILHRAGRGGDGERRRAGRWGSCDDRLRDSWGGGFTDHADV